MDPLSKAYFARRGERNEKPRKERKGLNPISEKRKAALKASGGWNGTSTFGPPSGEHRLQAATRMRHVRKWWQSQPKHEWKPKTRKRLRQIGERAKRWREQHKAWVESVWRVWERCIITQEDGSGFWPIDPHHCYDKSANGDKRFDVANGILLRRDVHSLADSYPEFHQALQEVADLCHAAAEGKRPPVTRNEARSIIFERAPKIRKYARPEVD